MLLCLLATQAAAVAPAPSDYEVAVAHRAAGRHAQAVNRYSAALQSEPDNVDALVGLGLSLTASGRKEQAEDALRRAVALAPEYWDAHVGLARLALERGDVTAARARLAPVLAGAPDHPDAVALARRLETPVQGSAPARRLDVWGGRSRLSGDRPSWSEAGAVLNLPVRSGWSASTAVEVTRRFGRDDVYLEGGVGRTYGGGATWRATVGGTPDADHRPELTVRGGGSIPVPDAPRPVEIILDGGWSRYQAVEVLSFSPGVRLAVNDRLTLQGRLVTADPSDGDVLSGYAVRAEAAAGPSLRLLLNWADAPESSEGRPATVETLSVGGARDLNDQLTVSLTATHEDRASFTRDEIVLGAAVRF